MSSAGFRIVTEAIRDRIKAALQDDVHVGPLDDLAAKDTRLVLFLYRVSVNADLRNAGHRRVGANPNAPIILYENALPFDLHFLVSASPSAEGTDLQGMEDLGLAIQALNDQPDVVGGALAGDVVRLSFEAMTTEEMGRIWALFPAANYRTSVVVLATPVWIDPAQPKPTAAPVTDETYAVTPSLGEPRNGY
ncbi:DUF4255 domain-containing protein [Bradyrhizobium symbiodeficiens]|uniref:DUF4255 domain-containing protein n=1 Tax=Bradyrhizobium symbiodeficiens TaxID=1404367 RepID=A0ABX5W3G1_9BRAD|nr:MULTISPECIES: DUF4255 domain-containing protein [Bradyrhizobium]QDF37519.1 DUF4255 domain-containing protein [Bradyrhizobium symbiodeficiens]